MIAGALFYYQFHSVKNRLATRVKRLREPKYLVGAIVGGLYFYYYLLRAFLRGPRAAVGAGAPGDYAESHCGVVHDGHSAAGLDCAAFALGPGVHRGGGVLSLSRRR